MANTNLADDYTLAEDEQEEATGPMNLEEIHAFIEQTGSTNGLTEAEYRLLEEAKRLANYAPGQWNENLLEKVPDGEQARLAQDIWKWVNWDEESREKWSLREQAGIRMMGVTDEVELPPDGLQFEGMAQVVHPGFVQAQMEFWARAFTELFPPEGPVKAVPMGKSNDERTEQAGRVADFLNWQYTTRMPGAYDEWSRLLFRLPMSGSVFTKVYYDTEEETAMVVGVEPSDFIVPYTCTDLRTAPRYTHRMWTASHIVKARMESGFYSDKSLVFATEIRYPETRRVIEDAEGREPTMFVEDRRHAILECHCYYALKDLNVLEGIPEEQAKDKALPWVVTMDRDSQKLLAIRRNWKEGDTRRKKRMWFSHKKFLPGLGFYGYGLPHIMAGLSRAQTGSLRALLDSAGMQNMGGGFISKDARVALDAPLGMGEWREVEATAEELSKAFYPRPLVEPSDVLFKLLGYLDEKQQALSSTTEIQVGDANNNAPVGTTLALIEQGAKKETAIRHGLHIANAEEFGILAELDGEFLPEMYPYEVEGDDKAIYRADFDGHIDVRPVSDPRLGTQTQRITQQQAILQLATQAPQLYQMREAHRRMLEALRVQDIDDLLVKEAGTQRMDPISEGMAMMTGKPVKTVADQDHAAHRLVHRTWLYSLQPALQQQLMPVYMAHDAEHAAWEFWLQMQQAMGMPLPYPAIMGGQGDDDDEEEQPPMPPEMENQIAALAAQAVQLMAHAQNQADSQAMMQQQAIQQTQAQAQQQAAAQQQAEEKQRQEEEFQREQARLDEEARREIERNSAIAQAEREQAAMESEAERIRQQEEQYPER